MLLLMVMKKLMARFFFFPLIVPAFAVGGSISDDDGKVGAGCDDRIELKEGFSMGFCSDARRSEIGDGCFVVIHKAPLEGRSCSWQGCGDFSLVGKPALKNGGEFVEYGIRSPSNGAGAVQVEGGWLPQHPFPRHYMKARDAAALILGACKTGAHTPDVPDVVKAKICSADLSIMNLNPYWMCYFGQP